MAQALHCFCCCSLARGPLSNPRNKEGHSQVYSSHERLLRKNGSWDIASLGSFGSVHGRSGLIDAGESQLLALMRCVAAAGNSSRSLASARVRERGWSSDENRNEDRNPAQLRMIRKSENRGPSTGRKANQKRENDEFEFQQLEPGRENLDVKGFPGTEAIAFRSNSRHTYETGVPRETFQKPEARSRYQEDGRSLDKVSKLGCEHFSRCSGCVVENALDRPPVLHEAVQFFKSRAIKDFSLTSSSLWEWRCRAKLAVRGTSEDPLIGLFEEGSHTIVNIPSCRTHHPRINAAVELVKEAIRTLCIEPYNEESGLGHLRYIQMVVTTHNTSLPATERYANGKVQVTLVWNARDEISAQAKFLQPMAEFLWRKGGLKSPKPILHSIWVNFQTSRTNLQIIFGGKWRHLLGEQEMWERIAGADICFTPASFGQANLQAFEALLRKLQTYVKRGSAVVELYAGVGVIGISLAATRACRSVKCVEVNKESKSSFELSLSRVPDSVNCKISWHGADASVSPINWLEGADTVIVDPPRKGLDPSVLEALRTASLRGLGKMKPPSPHATARFEKRPWVVRATQGAAKESLDRWDPETNVSWPKTLIYISCGWQSFKKDCAALVEDGVWHLDEAQAFNFFPGTDSIEVLAIFKSGKGGKKIETSKKLKVMKNIPSRKRVTL